MRHSQRTSVANDHSRAHTLPVRLIFTDTHIWMAKRSNDREIELNRANNIKRGRSDDWDGQIALQNHTLRPNIWLDT